MKEYELIRNMAGAFPRSALQKNELFECDAEIVEIGASLWGLTMDDFSPAEDLFTSEDPVRLGSNLAVATLSDLFAAGAEPTFFMHSVSLPRHVERGFVDGLMDGIQTTLGRIPCALCGGDMGTTDPWRYCGFAMGPIRSGRPLTRRLPQEQQTLWVTGKLGDANLAALQKTQTPQFELRIKEAELIRSYATGCIDTSGGLFDALWILHDQNPSLRFDIRIDDIPIAAGIEQAATAMGFPKEASLLGGAGEYELLFAIPESNTANARSALSAIEATCIGTTNQHDQGAIYLHRHDGLEKIMTEAPPCPRAAATTEKHVQEVMAMAHHLFGTRKRQ